jgi:hypothetical protein
MQRGLTAEWRSFCGQYVGTLSKKFIFVHNLPSLFHSLHNCPWKYFCHWNSYTKGLFKLDPDLFNEMKRNKDLEDL